MPSPEFESEIVNDMNKHHIICKTNECKSVILLPKSATYIYQEKTIPLVVQKINQNKERGECPNDLEELSDFWLVEDKMTFENIAFSKPVDNVRFLACADCEVGPVGYHDVATEKSYIALRRIEHKENP